MTKAIACIGSRGLKVSEILACESIGRAIAWPSDKMGGGGTGQGMRMSAQKKITLIDLQHTNPEWVVRMIQEAP